MGWSFAPDEPHVRAQFKSLLFGSAGLSGDPTIIAAAQSMFRAFAAGDRKAIHPNLRVSVYGIVMGNGGPAEFDVLLREVRTATDADERNTALRATGRGHSKELMRRALELPLGPDVKNQDIYMPLLGLRTEPEGQEMLWEWMKENWEELKVRCPPGLTMLGTLVKLCTSEFGTKEHLQQVEAFFEGQDRTGYKMALEQSLDTVRRGSGGSRGTGRT